MDALQSMAVMTNNYSHDIATAFLAVSGITMWMLSRVYRVSVSEEAGRYFVSIYRDVATVAKFSLAWIVIAGVPRILFYRQYEWSDMAGGLQVVAIIIKHIVMFLLVGSGVVYWAKLDKTVRSLERQYRVL